MLCAAKFSFFLSELDNEQYKLPERPSKEEEIEIYRDSLRLISIPLIITAIIFYNLKNEVSLTAALVALVPCISFLIYALITNLFKCLYYETKLKDEEILKLEIEEFYKKVESIKKIVESDYQKNILKNKNIILKKKSFVENKILMNTLQPIVQSKKNLAPSIKGKSETFFLSKLINEFENQVNIDRVPNIGKNPFQPDFLLICSKTKFHLVIEIDEPYSAKNGRPIHHNKSNDHDRNTFFTEINWAIIRFTEKQIIQNSDECCNLINNLLEAVNCKYKNIEHGIPLDKRWSYAEAIVMKNKDYRNTYLPANMKFIISDDFDNYAFPEGLPF